MASNPITEDDLNELCILRRKIEIVLDSTIDDTNARAQTLINIANDYLATMGEMLQSMLLQVMNNTDSTLSTTQSSSAG